MGRGRWLIIVQRPRGQGLGRAAVHETARHDSRDNGVAVSLPQEPRPQCFDNVYQVEGIRLALDGHTVTVVNFGHADAAEAVEDDARRLVGVQLDPVVQVLNAVVTHFGFTPESLHESPDAESVFVAVGVFAQNEETASGGGDGADIGGEDRAHESAVIVPKIEMSH